MPNNRLHRELWKMAFGACGCPELEVDTQMDKYSQEMPGIRHRLKDHDPLRFGDYEDPQPELDKWRIVSRIYHISVDRWWTMLPKEARRLWVESISKGYYPWQIDEYFWEMIERIAKNPLSVYEILHWECDLLPPGWIEYINKKA
ncbi:MAG: hypothetical protein Q8P40_06360 [Nitrospirota bacterium]|nr:hypothetical protein [Nitrospirota bacterium]